MCFFFKLLHPSKTTKIVRPSLDEASRTFAFCIPIPFFKRDSISGITVLRRARSEGRDEKPKAEQDVNKVFLGPAGRTGSLLSYRSQVQLL